MAKIINDIASYQPCTRTYMNELKRNGSKGVIVKLTEGNWCLNHSAGYQVTNALKVFGQVSVYHYLDGYSSVYTQAQYFYHWIKAFGLDKSTIWALDVEDPSLPWNCDSKINVFIHYMKSHGYNAGKVVYGSGSWFNEGRINRNGIATNKIWVAAYGAGKPGVDDTSVWQYTDNFRGLSTDASLDFNNTFTPVIKSKPKHKPVPKHKPAKSTDNYWHKTGKYRVTTSVNLYKDLHDKQSTGVHLDKGSIFITQQVFNFGNVTRLKTDVGYISGNKAYVRPIK